MCWTLIKNPNIFLLVINMHRWTHLSARYYRIFIKLAKIHRNFNSPTVKYNIFILTHEKQYLWSTISPNRYILALNKYPNKPRPKHKRLKVIDSSNIVETVKIQTFKSINGSLKHLRWWRFIGLWIRLWFSHNLLLNKW